MIKAIFFDQDNTLVNTREIAPTIYKNVIGDERLWQKWREVVEKVKHSTNPVERTFEYSLSQIIADRNLVDKISNTEKAELGRLIELNLGVAKFFENKIEGVKYILFTEDFDDQINIKLNKFGLKEKFDLIVKSSDVGVMKPNIKYLEMAWEKFGLDPKECLYIGDNYEKDCQLGIENGGKGLVFGVDFTDFGQLGELLSKMN